VKTLLKQKARIPENEVMSYVHDMRSGNELAREFLILNYIAYVCSIAARLAIQFPSKDSDLVGVGMITLIKCIDRIKYGKPMEDETQIAKYIYKSAYKEMLEFVRVDSIIRPPVNSKWFLDELTKRGYTEVLSEFWACEYLDVWSGEGTAPRSHCGKADSTLNQQINDLLTSPSFSRREKLAIQMRIEGYNLRQIGRSLAMSESGVSKLLEGTRKRVERHLWA